MVTAVGAACEEKRKVLEEQLALIEGEKNKVRYKNLVNLLHISPFSCHKLRSFSSDIFLIAGNGAFHGHCFHITKLRSSFSHRWFYFLLASRCIEGCFLILSPQKCKKI
jgi:hypothetical protein